MGKWYDAIGKMVRVVVASKIVIWSVTEIEQSGRPPKAPFYFPGAGRQFGSLGSIAGDTPDWGPASKSLGGILDNNRYDLSRFLPGLQPERLAGAEYAMIIRFEWLNWLVARNAPSATTPL